MVATKDKNSGGSNTEIITYRREADWGQEPVAATVIEAVASATNTPVIELDPLYNVINPDALNLLYTPTNGGNQRQTSGKITFPYNDCQVTVHADGEVAVTPIQK